MDEDFLRDKLLVHDDEKRVGGVREGRLNEGEEDSCGEAR